MAMTTSDTITLHFNMLSMEYGERLCRMECRSRTTAYYALLLLMDKISSGGTGSWAIDD